MKTAIKFLIIIFCLLFYPKLQCFAQTSVIFPDQIGDALLSKIVEEYTPTDTEDTLNYDEARDIMYSQIDNNNGMVSGVYTNYQITLDNNSDPSSNAFSQDINAEHVWPQSRGAGQEPARSDLHNLFPARVQVNSARGNKAFLDIFDPQTDDWYRNTEKLEVIPPTKIDEYSESNSVNFEPREVKKGDVARAVFYFYTIYRDEADNQAPGFFAEQQNTLCEWHKFDPVDSNELERSRKIAEFQSNENPFVIDESLAERLYCSNNS
ncbi:MAG: endonuclease [Cyanobacteria bacterium P01_G01_bin.49]